MIIIRVAPSTHRNHWNYITHAVKIMQNWVLTIRSADVLLLESDCSFSFNSTWMCRLDRNHIVMVAKESTNNTCELYSIRNLTHHTNNVYFFFFLLTAPSERYIREQDWVGASINNFRNDNRLWKSMIMLQMFFEEKKKSRARVRATHVFSNAWTTSVKLLRNLNIIALSEF